MLCTILLLRNLSCLFGVQTVNTCQSTQQSSTQQSQSSQKRPSTFYSSGVSKRLSFKQLRHLLSTSAPVLKRRSTDAVDAVAVLYFMNSFLTSGCLHNMRTSLSLSFRYNRCFCELASPLVKSKKSSEHCALYSSQVIKKSKYNYWVEVFK